MLLQPHITSQRVEAKLLTPLFMASTPQRALDLTETEVADREWAAVMLDVPLDEDSISSAQGKRSRPYRAPQPLSPEISFKRLC